MTDSSTGAHRWHKADSVLFVLTGAITRDHAVTAALSLATQVEIAREETDRHWAAMDRAERRNWRQDACAHAVTQETRSTGQRLEDLGLAAAVLVDNAPLVPRLTRTN